MNDFDRMAMTGVDLGIQIKGNMQYICISLATYQYFEVFLKSLRQHGQVT